MAEVSIWVWILGVGVLLYIASRVFRLFSQEAAIDREMEKVLTSDEHKVKGQYD
ncbi:MAG TPA: hypothetical protein VJB08_06340 [Candidatus Nanoarchaeia archaeon]|nr:hypothetical protein [Candidatus Nanoarchaeia archaeon]